MLYFKIVFVIALQFCLISCSEMTDWRDYSNAGWEKHNNEQYKEALELYKRAEEKINFGIFVDKEGLAILHTNMAGTYRQLGDYKNAETYYLSALHGWETIVGKQHENYAIIANNISLFYDRQNKLDEALKYAHESLQIRLKIYGEFNEDVAVTHRSLSTIYLSRRDTDNGLKHAQEALRISRKVSAENSELVASSELSLGTAYRRANDLPLAIQHLERAGLIYQEYYPNVTRSGDTLNELALLQQKTGDYKGANTNFDKALKIYESIYSGQHPYIAIVYDNMAHNLWEWGKHQSAIKSIEEGLKVSRNTYGDEHSFTKQLLKTCLAMSEASGILTACTNS